MRARRASNQTSSASRAAGALRLGLCCQFAQEPIKFRTTTATAMLRLSKRERLARLAACIIIVAYRTDSASPKPRSGRERRGRPSRFSRLALRELALEVARLAGPAHGRGGSAPWSPRSGAVANCDTLDCWRVESIQPGQRLRLAAEMKLPGRAWLEFEVQPDGDGTRLRQTATFDPLGFWGLAYWVAVWPLHQLVFAGMLRGLARAAAKNG